MLTKAEFTDTIFAAMDVARYESSQCLSGKRSRRQGASQPFILRLLIDAHTARLGYEVID